MVYTDPTGYQYNSYYIDGLQVSSNAFYRYMGIQNLSPESRVEMEGFGREFRDMSLNYQAWEKDKRMNDIRNAMLESGLVNDNGILRKREEFRNNTVSNLTNAGNPNVSDGGENFQSYFAATWGTYSEINYANINYPGSLQLTLNPGRYFYREAGGEVATQNSLGEMSPNSIYSMRGNDVDYQTLLQEFITGTGPEYSGFSQSHPIVKDMRTSWVVSLAITKFIIGGKKPLYNWDAPFGLFGLGLSNSMTEQFIGGARISIIPLSIGTAFIVNNTTDVYSGSYHLFNSFPREPDQITPFGTIYQRFMWIEK